MAEHKTSNLDIDVGLDKALEQEMSAAHLSVVIFKFSGVKRHPPTELFLLPTDIEGLLAYLFDISTHMTVEYVLKTELVHRPTKTASVFEYMFRIVESNDGTTNITPEFLDAVLKYGKFLR